jgi:hypothetical protein
MAKRDDKHSMAEDYLAQIKWRGEHPYRKGNPPEPEWKYKPVFSRQRSATNTTVIILLFGLSGVTGCAIFELFTTSHLSPGFLILIPLLILILFLLLANKPK